MAFCTNCGTKIEDGVKFCSGCGTPAISAGVEIKQDKAVNFIQTQPSVIPASSVFQNQNTPVMADEKYCFSCGAVIKKAAVMCPKCGVNQSMRNSTSAIDVYCTSCGKSIKKESSLCPFCGVSQGIGASGTNDKKGFAIASLVLGINSLWAFLIPLLGFPVSVLGVIMAIVGYKSSKKGMAMAGLIMSIVGFVATIIN